MSEVKGAISEPECFCDGNGYVYCWNGCDMGYVGADCGDDLCTGNECMHGLEDRPCEVCGGTGTINCPAHE